MIFSEHKNEIVAAAENGMLADNEWDVEEYIEYLDDMDALGTSQNITVEQTRNQRIRNFVSVGLSSTGMRTEDDS